MSDEIKEIKAPSVDLGTVEAIEKLHAEAFEEGGFGVRQPFSENVAQGAVDGLIELMQVDERPPHGVDLNTGTCFGDCPGYGLHLKEGKSHSYCGGHSSREEHDFKEGICTACKFTDTDVWQQEERAELAAAGKIDPKDVHVEAEIRPPDPAVEADRRRVYRCRKGHEQHGGNRTRVTSIHTNQVIAESGDTCMACFCLWMGQKFPTYPKEGTETEKTRAKSKKQRENEAQDQEIKS